MEANLTSITHTTAVKSLSECVERSVPQLSVKLATKSNLFSAHFLLNSKPGSPEPRTFNGFQHSELLRISDAGKFQQPSEAFRVRKDR